MNSIVKKTKQLISLGILSIAAATAPAQAADRQDVIAGVIVGVTAGYMLSEHNGHLNVVYRYPRHHDYDRHDDDHWRHYRTYDRHPHYHNKFCHHDARGYGFRHRPQVSYRHQRDLDHKYRDRHH